MSKQQYNVKLETEQIAAAESIAKREGWTVSWLIREAIKEYIKKHQK